MPLTIEAIEAEAMGLPAAERVELIERLLCSLRMDPALEEARATEVERRNNGSVDPIPGPEVLDEPRAEFE